MLNIKWISTLVMSVLLSHSISHTCLAGPSPEVSPLKAQIEISKSEILPNEIVELRVHVELEEGYKAYADQFQLKVVSAPVDQEHTFKVGMFSKIEPSFQFEDKFSKRTRTGVKDKAILVAPMEAPANVQSGGQIEFDLSYQACTEKFCLFPKTIRVTAEYKTKPAQEAAKPNNILEKGLLWGLLLCFLAGIATSLTPCVFPMIPITMTVLGKEAHARSHLQNFKVSLVYVAGMSIVYTSLGLIAAKTGALFGSFISHPGVLIVVCIVLLTMALSLFGLFDLNLPASWQTKFSHAFEHHGLWTVLIAGMFSGFIASPCVGPVLVGILTLIAQTQDLKIGFALMLAYSLGLGVLFIALGMSSKTLSLLPKSGKWMKTVKIILAFFLLGSFLYYLNLLKPHVYTVSETEKVQLSNWKSFKTASELEALMNEAQAQQKPVILDFYADWCAACHQLKKETFSTEEFEKATENFVLLQFDATNSSEFLDELKEKYQIFGLPTVVIHDRSGQWLSDRTVTEFITSTEFVKRLQGL